MAALDCQPPPSLDRRRVPLARRLTVRSSLIPLRVAPAILALSRNARAFFFVCAGLLALASHLGAANAGAQVGVGASTAPTSPVSIPTPANSTLPSCLAVNPDEHDPVTVIIRDQASNPVSDLSVVLDFSQCPAFNPCSTSTCPGSLWDPLNRTLASTTNLVGEARFYIDYTFLCEEVRIYADGMLFGIARFCSWGFGDPTNFETQSGPASVVIDDLHGDGRLDLVVANRNSNTVSVLRGNGNGTFQVKTDYPTGTCPASVALGDLNGDGRLDLAVANYGPSPGYGTTVSVLLNNGDGTFGAKTDFPTGQRPASVAIGDLSGDGKPDLVAANNYDNTVSVLLGIGDGNFAAKTDYPTGTRPVSVAIGEIGRAHV